mmetsp:Transcript_1949/g.4728  ORF Transcript_1949/g.4728 Transcript_1949/m.4728 type:complete len:242 (-) Transcript_1949:87-812(-)
MNFRISSKPIRRMAALQFSPSFIPSENPAPSATTFFRAPQISTPRTLSTRPTRKRMSSNTVLRSLPWSSFLYPIVLSQKHPAATSLAMLAPISTEMSIPPSLAEIRSEMSTRPLASKSRPLMRETPMQSEATLPTIFSQRPPMNWWGMTKTSMLAPATAFSMQDSATRLVGSLYPGRYLTFSCVSFMTSVSFLPSSITSSYTHIMTRESRWPSLSAFLAMILAMAHPQLPLPMMAILRGVS